jgi:hypothetical protein
MDLAPLRARVTQLGFAAHGVPATVTRPLPDDTPISTRGIWVTPGLSRPFTDPLPRDFALQRREPERVIALPRSEVPTLPTGTRVDAPEQLGGAVRAWRVDAIDYVDAAQYRAFVVLETEP